MLWTYFRFVLEQHQHILRPKCPSEQARNLPDTGRRVVIVDSNQEDKSGSESELTRYFFVNVIGIKNLRNQKLV